jgi:hypothetical protein
MSGLLGAFIDVLHSSVNYWPPFPLNPIERIGNVLPFLSPQFFSLFQQSEESHTVFWYFLFISDSLIDSIMIFSGDFAERY